MDAVTGLMPDAVSVVYFAPKAETLRGLVRFGAQATQSMSRGEAEEDGEFFPGVHGGAIAMVLADAAVYFARISWKANAMLKKISVQLLGVTFARCDFNRAQDVAFFMFPNISRGSASPVSPLRLWNSP